MRILLISENTRPHSGWGTYTRGTVQAFVDRQHDVCTVLRTASSAPVCTELTGLPNPLSLLSSPCARLKSAWIIRRAIRRHRPDVIHILIEPYALAMPLVRLLGTLPPWVMNFHGTYSIAPFMSARTRSIAKRAYEQASRFLACSQYTYEQVRSTLVQCRFEGLLRSLQERTTFFRLGIIPPASSVATPRADAREKTVLFVGELKSRKGVMELVRGFHTFTQESVLPTRLLLIGNYDSENPYIVDLCAYIHDHGLDDRVTLHGRASDEELQHAYAHADVFVMLSKKDGMYFEGFGLVFLEANARGIPVIGSIDSGCREAIDDGVSGYAVDAFDPQAIAEKLEWVLIEKRIDPARCIAWAKRHSIAQQIDSFEQVYRDLMPSE